MVVVMEFLDNHVLLDHVLVDEKLTKMNVNIAIGLGEFMGITHAKTHSSLISQDLKEKYSKLYENRAMRDVQLEFVFTKCYKEATDEQRSGLNVTDEFLKEIDLLKLQYDGKYSEYDNLVLCHGDLHPGSVMVDNDDKGSVKVIDPEFTIYGPPGLDVGSLLSGYCLGAIHQAYSQNPNAVNDIINNCQLLWDSYIKTLKLNGLVDSTILYNIEIETVGFTVAEVCRTALEFAGGRKWLQFENLETKTASKKAALQLVDKCMIQRHTGGITLLMDTLKQVTTL